jgi:hypothetical protein
MGFGYKDWSEVFYPREMKCGDYLPFYAKHFETVELDTTFHAVPDRDRVRNWALAVPDNFRFCAKMPKQVTHERDFGLAGAAAPENVLSRHFARVAGRITSSHAMPARPSAVTSKNCQGIRPLTPITLPFVSRMASPTRYSTGT